MAVNGIRVSALPEMDVADLTKDDFLIVNDGNTNTKRINFEKFLGAVDQNITEHIKDLEHLVEQMPHHYDYLKSEIYK